MNQRGDSTLWHLVDVGVAIVVPITCLMLGWCMSAIYDHGQRISAMEANRYTAKEAKEDQRILVESVAGIKDALHVIDKKATELNASITEIRGDVKSLKN